MNSAGTIKVIAAAVHSLSNALAVFELCSTITHFSARLASTTTTSLTATPPDVWCAPHASDVSLPLNHQTSPQDVPAQSHRSVRRVSRLLRVSKVGEAARLWRHPQERPAQEYAQRSPSSRGLAGRRQS